MKSGISGSSSDPTEAAARARPGANYCRPTSDELGPPDPGTMPVVDWPGDFVEGSSPLSVSCRRLRQLGRKLKNRNRQGAQRYPGNPSFCCIHRRVAFSTRTLGIRCKSRLPHRGQWAYWAKRTATRRQARNLFLQDSQRHGRKPNVREIASPRPVRRDRRHRLLLQCGQVMSALVK
jgi:hypothetical protein